jgi:hypothetical protein
VVYVEGGWVRGGGAGCREEGAWTAWACVKEGGGFLVEQSQACSCVCQTQQPPVPPLQLHVVICAASRGPVCETPPSSRLFQPQPLHHPQPITLHSCCCLWPAATHHSPFLLLRVCAAAATTPQVEGARGLPSLIQKVRVGGPTVLYHGALAASAATFVGHYPWFATVSDRGERGQWGVGGGAWGGGYQGG